jgi:hypothetical protein
MLSKLHNLVQFQIGSNIQRLMQIIDVNVQINPKLNMAHKTNVDKE